MKVKMTKLKDSEVRSYDHSNGKLVQHMTDLNAI